jgi:Bacterial regulatory proteins, gntR family
MNRCAMDPLERVVDQIMSSATRTADGSIARLPTERQLAETLGISRGALREQLAALESLGLVTRTQGSGIHLAATSPTPARLYFDLSVRLGLITTDQLERGREMFEETVVRAVAVKATAADHNFHRCLHRIVDTPVLKPGRRRAARTVGSASRPGDRVRGARRARPLPHRPDPPADRGSPAAARPRPGGGHHGGAFRPVARHHRRGTREDPHATG